MLDFLKMEQITGFFTCLTSGGKEREATDVGISSVIDTWLLLRDIELGGERNRGLYVLKGRGLAHSNQIREFLLTPNGIQLREAYVGAAGVLTGSMRLAQEAKERVGALEQQREVAAKVRSFERKRRALEAQIAALRSELEEEEGALRDYTSAEVERTEIADRTRREMARSRKAEASDDKGTGGNGNGNKRTARV